MRKIFIIVISLIAIFLPLNKASAQLHGFSTTAENTSGQNASSLPVCGGYLPQHNIAASPATLWTYRLGSPSRIFDAPWLIGCQPAQLTAQSPHNRGRHAIAFNYNQNGMVAAWVWQITLSEEAIALLTREGRNRYAANGLLLESIESCDHIPQNNPLNETHQIYRFNYDQSNRLNRMEHTRPANCNYNQTTPIHLLSIYSYDDDEGTITDLPQSLTEQNLITQNTSIFEAEYLYNNTQLQSSIFTETQTGISIEERYDYNNNLLSRLTRLQEQGNISQRYTYLYANRLSKIEDAANQNSWQFHYNGNGQLTSLNTKNPAPFANSREGYINFRASY